MRKLLALIFAVVASGAAMAQTPSPGPAFENGNDLYRYLTATATPLTLIGIAYIAGVADAGSSGIPMLGGWRFCLQLGITRTQLADVVKVWLEQHPEKRHYAAANLVAQAFEGAFPCK